MSLKEFFRSKRTWTIIGLGVWSIAKQLFNF